MNEIRIEFAVAAVLAAVVFMLLQFSRWRTFGAWLSLGMVGQAAALQLIEAGKACWYQHYLRPPGRMLLWPASIYLSIVVVQAGVVLWGIVRWRREIGQWIQQNFTLGRIALAFGAFALTSATISAYLPHYAFELIFATCIQSIQLANIAIAVRSLPPASAAAFGERLHARLWPAASTQGERSNAIHPWVWPLALVAFALPAAMNWIAYERYPHVNDEAISLYQARILAAGRLWLEPPPVPEAFELDHMYLTDGKWFGVYSPGWPAVLAPVAPFGLAGLVNPLFNGMNVLLAYMLVRRLYGESIALAGAALLTLSPWNLFMAMSFMSHTLTLSLTLGVAILLTRLHERYSLRDAALVGALVGMIVLTRPLDGWVVMLAAGLYLLSQTPRYGIGLLAWVIVGGLPFLGIQLAYNHALTGQATRFPLMAYYDEHHGPGVNSLGFGPGKGRHWPSLDAYPGHSPIESLINANMNAFAVNSEMFGWATGSLWPAILLLAWGKVRRTDLLLIAVTLINVTVFALYWSSGGPDFGARYWSLSLVPLVVLSVRGGRELGTRLAAAGRAERSAMARVVLAMGCLTLMSLCVYLPWRCIDKYHGYLGLRPTVARLARERGFGESLVLVYGGYFDYLSAAVFNPVNLHASQPIYAWARDAEIQDRVLAAYPDRPVWILRGPSVDLPTGEGDRLDDRWSVEGPVLPSQRSRRMPAPPNVDTSLP